MVEKKEQKSEKPEQSKAEVVEVTTQTAPAIKLETGEIINEMEFLVRLYNKLLVIEKAVA